MGLFQVSNGIRGGTAFKFSIAMEILDDIKIVWWKKSHQITFICHQAGKGGILCFCMKKTKQFLAGISS